MPEGSKLCKSTEKLEVSMHVIRTWCQPSDKLSVYKSMRCRHAWKQHMRTDMQKHEMSPYLQSKNVDRHVGARGAAAHATGAMQSDTRAATNLMREEARGFDSFWEFSRSVTTPVLSRRLKEFLFELRVVQGRPFRVRHAFEVPVTSKLDHGRRPGLTEYRGNTRHRTRARKRSLRNDRTRVPFGRYVATERPFRYRTSVPLGRYVATELEPSLVATDRARAKLGLYVATERPFHSVATSLRSDRASVPLSSSQARSLRSDRASVPLGRYVATDLEPSSVAT
ncbi:hypothetical protein F2Q68_00005294 [Brassica cretica]|uniref:Uncharacterized protein n=1 Tax=Brassica cretica TaxID=69181 RepID=A0A8S9JLG1_BRACR|nr:hypothetical protein F2Q68_00005294 [Brassica cretica]